MNNKLNLIFLACLLGFAACSQIQNLDQVRQVKYSAQDALNQQVCSEIYSIEQKLLGYLRESQNISKKQVQKYIQSFEIAKQFMLKVKNVMQTGAVSSFLQVKQNSRRISLKSLIADDSQVDDSLNFGQVMTIFAQKIRENEACQLYKRFLYSEFQQHCQSFEDASLAQFSESQLSNNCQYVQEQYAEYNKTARNNSIFTQPQVCTTLYIIKLLEQLQTDMQFLAKKQNEEEINAALAKVRLAKNNSCKQQMVTVVGIADEYKELKITCPNKNQQISKVEFASYGNPTGELAGSFKVSSCHSKNSQQVVEAACLKNNSCTIQVSNTVFQDLCSGQLKKLAVEVVCSD